MFAAYLLEIPRVKMTIVTPAWDAQQFIAWKKKRCKKRAVVG
jgi:hypothetical protein